MTPAPAMPAAVRAIVTEPIETGEMVLPTRFADPGDWSELQLGYRVDARTGASLVGTGEGAWRPDWWVIATNGFADPFFVDLAEIAEGYPIHFAPHGAGAWTPMVVAESPAAFADAVRRITALASRPLEAATFVESNLPANAYWEEVAETLRESDE